MIPPPCSRPAGPISTSHQSFLFGRKLGDLPDPRQPRVLFLRAHDEAGDDLAIAGRLRLEEDPCLLVPAKDAAVRFRKLERHLFVAVNCAFRRVARVERLQPGRTHAALLLQILDLAQVDSAPDAALPARRKANLVAGRVVPLADAVDPADT